MSCYCVTELMKEPILQDKRLQHVKFCKCASELIESVLGKPQNASIEASLERIRKVCYISVLCLVILQFSCISVSERLRLSVECMLSMSAELTLKLI